MAYDLYLYHSRTGVPDFDEADSITTDEEETFQDATPEVAKRQADIATALMRLNPRLQTFELDYTAIADLQSISVSEARATFDYIELLTPKEDLATQITIFRNYVLITIPYWYEGEQAAQVFGKANEYAMTIHQVAGYFAFDPQSGRAYDPSLEGISSSSLYEGTSAMAKKLPVNSPTLLKKAWWKFW